MSVRHPAAVYTCDCTHCDSLAVVDTLPHEYLNLPVGWWSLNDYRPDTEGWIFCSVPCFTHKAIELRDEEAVKA